VKPLETGAGPAQRIPEDDDDRNPEVGRHVSHQRSRDIMRFGIGRRQVVISIVNQPARDGSDDFPMAVNATDRELARLNSLQSVIDDRARWESTALLYGSARLTTA
jgi:hypothetical protein